MTLRFLVGQLADMREHGYEVHVASTRDRDLVDVAEATGARPHAIQMTRGLTPLADFRALIRLICLLRHLRPRIVHAHTPKAGLLAMLAAWVTRVPVRVYHVHGLPADTAIGLRRQLLLWSDRIACILAHRVLAVSESLRRSITSSGISRDSKVRVICNGSISGVDTLGAFNPERQLSQKVARLELDIPSDSKVVGFAGRIAHDKGLDTLLEAWRLVVEEESNVHLVLAGGLDESDPVSRQTLEALESDGRVHMLGTCENMPTFYASIDVLVVPSRREGFGMVALEANAMSRPVVASRITGLIDAVSPETALFVPPDDPLAIARALNRYFSEPNLMRAHGDAGRRRAKESFDPHRIWEGTRRIYAELLAKDRQSKSEF